MARIFWVEDQSHWIDKFQRALLSTDFDRGDNVLETFKFPQAAKQWISLAAKADKPDIAILDARMSGADDAGFSVAGALRKKWPGLPIIYLSEHSGTGLERDALEKFGALDFIAKHQRNVEEVLCWRIRAVLRQGTISSSHADSPAEHVLTSGGLTIDLTSWEVYWRKTKLMNPSNAKRPLPPTPRKILRCLVERSPRPVTTTQIAEHLTADLEKFSYATYRQHIKTLRRSFDAAEGGNGSFMNKFKNGSGIVTFGDEGAYCWKPPAQQ